MDMSQVITHPFFTEVKKTGKTKEVTEWCAKHDLRNLAGVVLMPELNDDSKLACKMLDDMLILLGNGTLLDNTPSDIAKKAVENSAGTDRVASKHEALVGNSTLVIEEDEGDKDKDETPDLDEKSDVRSEKTALQGNVPDPAEIEDLARDASRPVEDNQLEDNQLEAIGTHVREVMDLYLTRAIPTIVTAVLDESDKRYINIKQDIELIVKERK